MPDRSHATPTNVDRRSMLKRTGAILGGLMALGVSNGPLQFAVAPGETHDDAGPAAATGATGNRVVADPTSLPAGPIGRLNPSRTTSRWASWKRSRRSSRAWPSTT